MNAAARHHHRAGTRRRRQKYLLTAFGIAVAGLLALMLIFSSGSGGTNLPDFAASTLTGETVHLSDYHGQVIMLNFWATWCPPCRAEMPTIQAAYARYRDQGFTVLAINNAEQVAQIQPFAEALALQFPVLLDTSARLQKTFGITGYPTSLFISPAGEIYKAHSGMLTAQQLDSYIAAGLAKRDSKL